MPFKWNSDDPVKVTHFNIAQVLPERSDSKDDRVCVPLGGLALRGRFFDGIGYSVKERSNGSCRK